MQQLFPSKWIYSYIAVMALLGYIGNVITQRYVEGGNESHIQPTFNDDCKATDHCLNSGYNFDRMILLYMDGVAYDIAAKSGVFALTNSKNSNSYK